MDDNKESDKDKEDDKNDAEVADDNKDINEEGFENFIPNREGEGSCHY